MRYLIAILLVLGLVGSASAEYVRGHYRTNGTYVHGYHRSDRNNTVRDNYSYKGNTNPYTGKTGTNSYGGYSSRYRSHRGTKRLLGQ